MKKVVSLMLVLMLSMLLMPMAWAEACEHPEGYQSDASEWIDWKAGIVDSKTHEIVGTYIGQNHCSLCDTVYDTGVVRYGSSFIENHIWENNVCVDCGYRNTCSHPYDQKSTYTYVSGSVTNTTSTTHTITGEKYEETYCSACDTILSSKVVSRNASGTENHTFNDKGKCAVCDYVNTCNHRNIDVDTGYYWYETEQVNENAHREYGELVEEYFCKDCQTIYQTNVLDENFSILQDHTYEGNKCTACGYISKCQHPSQYLATMTVHHFVSSRNIDEKTHRSTYTISQWEICHKCSKQLSDEVVVNNKLELVQPHEFVAGKCVCGANNACNHPSDAVKTEYYMDGVRYEQIDATTHCVIGEQWADQICTKCGDVLRSYVNEAKHTEIAEHDYFRDYCECGAKVSCSHPANKQVVQQITDIKYYRNGIC